MQKPLIKTKTRYFMLLLSFVLAFGGFANITKLHANIIVTSPSAFRYLDTDGTLKPLMNATNVPINNTTIYADFTQDMELNHPSHVSINGRNLSFISNDPRVLQISAGILTGNTLCTLKVSRFETSGHVAIMDPVTVSFRTVAAPVTTKPDITSTVPFNNDTKVSTDLSAITINFDNPIDLSTGSVTYRNSSSSEILITNDKLSLSSDKKTLTINSINLGFTYDNVYTFTAQGFKIDPAGPEMTTRSFSFRTAVKPRVYLASPSNSSNVDVNTKISIYFEEEMDTNKGNVILKSGSAEYPLSNRTYEYSNGKTTFTFTPQSTLESNKTYTIYISNFESRRTDTSHGGAPMDTSIDNFTFSTSQSWLTITPSDGTTANPDTSIIINFAERVSYPNNVTVTLKDKDNNSVDFDKTWASNERRLTLKPKTSLKGSNKYTVKVTYDNRSQESTFNTYDGKYTLTVRSSTGGKIVNSPDGKYSNGNKIYIEAAYNQQNSNYEFVDWTSNNDGYFDNKNSLKTYFEMPAKDVTITANFKYVTSENNGGTGSSSAGNNPRLDINGSTIYLSDINTSGTSYPISTSEKNGKVEGYIPITFLEKLVDQVNNKDFTLDINVSNGYSISLPASIVKTLPNLYETIKDKNLDKENLDLKVILTNQSSNSKLKDAFAKISSNGQIITAFDLSMELINRSTGSVYTRFSSFGKNINRMISSSSSLSMTALFKLEDATNSLIFVPQRTNISSNKNNTLTTTSTNEIVALARNPVNFNDVSYSFWGKRFIDEAACKNLLVGVGSNLYEPERSITRAEFVRMVVAPLNLGTDYSSVNDYVDVDRADWYYKSIMQAKKAGFLTGFSSTSFSPNTAITRQEMTSILSRAIASVGTTRTPSSPNLQYMFKDYNEMDKNYISDISTVVGYKIIFGMNNGTFNPRGLTTRAQAATVNIQFLKALGYID